MKKRLLSLLLVMIMLIGVLPIGMAAAEDATVITLDFNAAAAEGKAVTAFTEADDGWAYYEAGSSNVTPMFYNSSSWDYKCLRFKADAAGAVGAIAFTAPVAGTYSLELTYCLGNTGNNLVAKVGGVNVPFNNYGTWGTAPAVVTADDVVLTAGSNLLSITPNAPTGQPDMMIKQAVFTLVEAAEDTAVALDFNAAAAEGKAVTAFTEAADGWALDTDAASDVTPQFYKHSTWDYSCLRFTQTAAGGVGAVKFDAPVDGTYRMDLTYCVGNSATSTEVTVGGTTTSFFAYAAWGNAPKSVTTHGVQLTKGSNTLTITTAASVTVAQYLLIKDVTFTLIEPADKVVADFNLVGGLGKTPATYTMDDYGWQINAESTGTIDFYKNANWDYRCLRVQSGTAGFGIDVDIPAAGTYDVTVVYGRGNNAAKVDMTVGGTTVSTQTWAAWGNPPITAVAEDVVLQEGTNTITFVPAAWALIKKIVITPKETVFGINFDEEFLKTDKGENVANYTIAEDGWCFNTEKSANVEADWYRWVNSSDNSINWGYRVLRLKHGAGVGQAVVDFDVPIAGTYTVTFEYAMGNNCNMTDVSVGGVSASYHGWTNYGPENSYKAIVFENAKLTEGVNSITFSTREVAAHVFLKSLNFELVELSDGSEPVCEHTNTSVVGCVDNGDGTHVETVACDDCGVTVGENTVTCTDEDANGVCDGCEAVLEVPCDHAETTSETVYNGNKTHTTTVTCVCGEVVSTETADCVDEDKDCACDTCEGVIKTVTKTTVAGSNMNLGNELQVNFIINDPKVAGDYVAYIHQDTDDEGGVTYEIPSSDWEFFSTGRSKVGVRVRAMEMTDTLTLTIKDAEGYDIIDAYTTSVREYAAKALVAASSSAEMKTLVVDMVNYGAAAQTNFTYKAEDLANNQLTEEQAALASADVVCENKQIKGTNNIGANLALNDCILFNVYFKGLKDKDMSTINAKVYFDNWKGEYVEVTIPGTEFELYGASGDQYKVMVDDIVLADAKCLVTVELYEDGVEEPIAYGSDSVESYANRGSATAAAPLYNAIMKFATSAKAYLLSRQ